MSDWPALVLLSFWIMMGFAAGYILRGWSKIIVFLQLNAVMLAWSAFLIRPLHGPLFNLEQAILIVSLNALGVVAGHIYQSWHKMKSTIRLKEEELKSINIQYNDSMRSIVHQDEIERKALAGDLHDQVLNDLKELKENAGKYSESQLVEKIDLSANNIREVMDSLSPLVLENLGLLASIEDCLRRGAQKANYKLRVKFLVEKSALDKYSIIEQTLVYRIVQEVTNNICKHSKATKVRVSAREELNQIKIVIEDDGVGIKSGEAASTSRGMLYMKQRASLIGANVYWKPATEGNENETTKGCVVEIFLPEKKS